MIPLEKIKEISAARGSKNAIYTEDKKTTWTELYETVSTITSNLTSKFDPNSELAMCYLAPNCLELIYLMSAAATLKIPCTGIDYTQSICKIEAMLKETGCNILVTSSSYCIENNINLVDLSRNTTIIDIDNNLNNNILYEELIAPITKPIDRLLLQPKPFKSVSFTSGTSGIPKSVIRKKSFDGRRFSFFTARYGFSSEDIHLLAMPLYHAAGSGWSRLFMQLGATIVIAKPHDTAHMADLLKREWITTSAMTPPLLNEVVKNYSNLGGSSNNNNLNFIIVGGKHFHPQAKLQAISTLGPVVYEYYGTTETGVNVLAEPKDIISNPTSVGRAYDGNSIIVLDKTGNALPSNEVGRIAIASYMNMDGYGNQDTEFVELDGKKYLITAEMGKIDCNGSIYLSNRAQGESNLNIYELENEVRHLPGIKDLAMVPSGKNKVYCGFVTNDDFFVDDKELIRNIKYICKKQKVKCELIGGIEAVPYSPSGKVQNIELKDQIILSNKSEEITTETSPSTGVNISMTQYLVAALCLLGTAISWGAMFPITKNALITMDAVHISLIRYGTASLIFALLLIMKEGISSLLPGKDFFKLWLFGSLGFAGFSILAFAGLAYTKPQHGAIIMALMPLISAIMMWTIKKIKPTKFTFYSIIFALFGVVLVVTKGNVSALSGGSLLPSLVILLGAFCWVTYTLGANYVKGYSVLRYTTLSCLLGAFTILIVALITNTLEITKAPSIEEVMSIKWELLYLITFAGVIAVFSWNYGINTLGPINGVLFINLVPITAFTIGLVKGEVISEAELAGAGITIAVLLLNNIYTRWASYNKNNTKFKLQTMTNIV